MLLEFVSIHICKSSGLFLQGDRQPEFDFKHRGVIDVGAVDWSPNLINPQAFLIPKDPKERGEHAHVLVDVLAA